VSRGLQCSKHNSSKRAYIACIHVLQGGPIKHFRPSTGATPETAGEILCAACDKHPDIRKAHAICGGSADIMGLTTAEGA